MVSQIPRRAHASASKLSYPFSVALTTRSRGHPLRNASSTLSAMDTIRPLASAASSATRSLGQTPWSASGSTGSQKPAR
jgi:hypothetical protein